MAHRLIDISSNNPHPINWAEVKGAGVDGVLIKATEGTGYTNPDYVGDRDGARAAGLEVAAYHFASFTDAALEAAHFHSVAGADAKMLDVESSENASWMDEFLASLGQAANEEMTYGSASTLPKNITRGLLWVAAWGGTPPAEGEVLWQYTDAASVAGVTAPVDESEWLGTEQQYTAFFTGGSAPAPTPPTPVHITVPNVTVKEVQTELNKFGAGLATDDIWGPLTEAAVVHFQQAHPPLAVDGIVGPETWSRLLGPTPPVPPAPAPHEPQYPLPGGDWFGPESPNPHNHSGVGNAADQEKFKPWQERMKERGWTIVVDGIYGPQTDAVCREFQVQKGLAVDGLVGPATWNAAWTLPVT